MTGSISKRSFDMHWILWDQNKNRNTNTNTNMHTPITAVQLDVSVTTQWNILLSLTYTHNKITKIYLWQNSSWCLLTAAQRNSQRLWIKIMSSSTQAATLKTTVYHVVYFLGMYDKILPEFQIYLIPCVAYKITMKQCQR